MLPVYKIVDYSENRYLLARAVMKRARQINFLGDEELDAFEGKIVSLALNQVLSGNLHYNYVKKEQQE